MSLCLSALLSEYVKLHLEDHRDNDSFPRGSIALTIASAICTSRCSRNSAIERAAIKE